jgi:hypothetical protein
MHAVTLSAPHLPNLRVLQTDVWKSNQKEWNWPDPKNVCVKTRIFNPWQQDALILHLFETESENRSTKWSKWGFPPSCSCTLLHTLAHLQARRHGLWMLRI